MKEWTLGGWLWEWYLIYKAPYLAANSLRNIEQMIRLHIPEELKRLRLSQLSAHEVEQALAPMGRTRTREYARQVLFSALSKAQRLGFVKDNVVSDVDKIKYKRNRSRALKLAEQAEFLRALETSRYKWVMLFYLFTGTRRAEALALTDEDIDIEGRLIHIKGTKTEESDRYIPLSETVAAIIEGQRRQNRKERRAGRKLPKGRIFPFGLEQTSREFKRLCPNHHLHELRHTFITRCAESGVNASVCQQIVGHSTSEMTLDVYMHVMDEFKRKEYAKFTITPDF